SEQSQSPPSGILEPPMYRAEAQWSSSLRRPEAASDQPPGPSKLGLCLACRFNEAGAAGVLRDKWNQFGQSRACDCFIAITFRRFGGWLERTEDFRYGHVGNQWERRPDDVYWREGVFGNQGQRAGGARRVRHPLDP